MIEKHRYLFVYGTLRGGAGHPMHGVLARSASLVCPATVCGTLYSLGEYPGLVPRQDGPGVVKGEVYEIDPTALERTLALLDDYEGIGPDEPLPHEYRRELVAAVLDDGRKVDAWAYILNRSPEVLRRIDSGDFAEWRKL